MTKEEFYLKLVQMLSDKGVEVLKIAVPALLAWHMKPPPWMNKKTEEPKDEESK